MTAAARWHLLKELANGWRRKHHYVEDEGVDGGDRSVLGFDFKRAISIRRNLVLVRSDDTEFTTLLLCSARRVQCLVRCRIRRRNSHPIWFSCLLTVAGVRTTGGAPFSNSVLFFFIFLILTPLL